jgi:hypothetical protein
MFDFEHPAIDKAQPGALLISRNDKRRALGIR